MQGPLQRPSGDRAQRVGPRFYAEARQPSLEGMNARVSMRQDELAPGGFARDARGARDQLGLAGTCREHHGHIR